jgi:hypothetical protein
MKTTKTLLISAALLSLPLANAQADILQFWNPEASAFVKTDQLDLTSTTGNYSVTQNLGINNEMDTNDTFSESISLFVTSSSLGGGATNFDLLTNYRLDVTLQGVFQNITSPMSINADGTINNVNTTQYDVKFTSAVIDLYGDNAAISAAPGSGTYISSLGFESGGASAIQLVAGQAIGDVALLAAFDNQIAPCTTNCDNWVRDENGNSIVNALKYLTITTTSAKFLSTSGVKGDEITTDGIQTIIFQDDQGSTVFNNVPEPSSLFLIGAGLLGFGFFGRRKNTSNISA